MSISITLSLAPETRVTTSRSGANRPIQKPQAYSLVPKGPAADPYSVPGLATQFPGGSIGPGSTSAHGTSPVRVAAGGCPNASPQRASPDRREAHCTRPTDRRSRSGRRPGRGRLEPHPVEATRTSGAALRVPALGWIAYLPTGLPVPAVVARLGTPLRTVSLSLPWKPR